MGSLDAMTKGSESRYYGDTQTLKIAQGVSGTVRDKGSIRRTVPFMVQAVKQGFQDLGARDVAEVSWADLGAGRSGYGRSIDLFDASSPAFFLIFYRFDAVPVYQPAGTNAVVRWLHEDGGAHAGGAV